MDINELIIQFFKDNKMYMGLYSIFMMVYPLYSVYMPQFYSGVMDEIKEGKTPHLKPVAIIFIVANIMFTILDRIDSYFIPKFQAYLRVNIVSAILNSYKNNIEDQEIGKLISKIIKLPIVVRELFKMIRNVVIPALLIILGCVIKFIMINKKIATLYITFLVFISSVFFSYIKTCIYDSEELQNVNEKNHENITELFDNMIDIYSMNKTDDEISNLEKEQLEIINKYRETFQKSSNMETFLTLSFSCMSFATIGLAFKLYKSNEIDFSSLVDISIISFLVSKKINSVSDNLPETLFNIGVYNGIRKYLIDIGTEKDTTTKENFVSTGNLLFDNLTVNYKDKYVVNNFNLSVNAGDKIGIMGKIGSGKSSIVKALMKLVQFSGEIYMDGKPISTMNSHDIRKNIVFISQSPLPFNRTLYENIVYGNESVTKEQVKDILNTYDLNSYFSVKLDEKVGKRGSKLSGGQKMIMFLIRILLLHNKNIIILDEPTSSLDNDTATQILELINYVTKDKTTLIITHDERVKQYVDRVIILNK